MTEVEFAKGMGLLAAAIGRQISRETMEAWFLVLGDMSADEFNRGIVESLKSHKFAGLPPLGVVREHAVVSRRNLACSDRALIAWSVIKSCVAKHGAYATVDFDDPVVNVVIRRLGGWPRICDTPAGEAFDVWLKRDFCSLYEASSQLPIQADDARPIHGLVDISNSATGHELCEAVRIETGLPKDKSVTLLGERTVAIPCIEVRSLASAFSLENSV